MKTIYDPRNRFRGWGLGDGYYNRITTAWDDNLIEKHQLMPQEEKIRH